MSADAILASGPNWIHGTPENPIMDLAAETGTILHSWGDRQSGFDEQGHTIPLTEVSEISDIFWGVIADAMFYSYKHCSAISSSISLMDFVEQAASDKWTNEPPEEAKRKRNLLFREAEMWGAFVGSPIQKQSLKFFWLEECIEGENPFVADTFKKILERVAEPALSKAQIKLQHNVTAVVSDESGDCVTVQTSNGYKEIFDEVIVTVPLGWLQRNKAVFDPALPSRLSKAIDSIGYGCLDKVYITFPTAFWDQPQDLGEGMPDGDHRQSVPNANATNSPLNLTSTGFSTPLTNHYPGFTHWLKPSYAIFKNPQRWNQQSLNLAALPSSCAHPTLLFYIFGECATHVAHLVSTTPASSVDARLTDFFRPYFSLLPNYSSTNPICVPKAVLATTWANDEFAGYGSYSNFQVGLENGDEDIECMREGLPDRHVWLAGEHTAPFAALGTVTGAWWSGQEVAKRIVETYGLTEGDHGQVE